MGDFYSIALSWLPVVLGIGVLLAFGWVLVVGTIRQVRSYRARARRLALPKGHFVFAKILDAVSPMERAEKYETPLDSALGDQGLGMVTGSGSQVTATGQVEWVGLDLELADLERGIEFTLRRLRELGAPPGSVLEYRVGEREISVEIVPSR